MDATLENLKKVYQMLEDEESRDIYLNRVNFYISADFRHFEQIINTYLPQITPLHSDRLEEMVASLPADKDVILYGAGEIGAQMLPYVQKNRRFVGFCSQTKEKQEKGFCGYPVMSPEELVSRKDMCVVLAANVRKLEILKLLKDNDYPEELIFDGMDAWRVADCDPGQYFNPDFMKFEDGEVFVDAGCFDFGTSLTLREYCPSIKKIYAFEPDPESYQRCVERRDEAGLGDRAVILPFGTWSERKTLKFNVQTSGSSRICRDEDGEREKRNSYMPGKTSARYCEISVMSIDEAVEAGDKVTMIKMDVEGSELESLKGARNTIMRDKPKLAICIYHKPEDMWEIPLYIKELVPEYRFYVRHHSSGIGETVLYAVMP